MKFTTHNHTCLAQQIKLASVFGKTFFSTWEIIFEKFLNDREFGKHVDITNKMCVFIGAQFTTFYLEMYHTDNDIVTVLSVKSVSPSPNSLSLSFNSIPSESKQKQKKQHLETTDVIKPAEICIRQILISDLKIGRNRMQN